MRTSAAYAAKTPDDVRLFIARNPLAWVVSGDGIDIEATPLPLVAECADDGTVRALIGHFARTNRHVELLHKNGRALCIFHGNQGYISPSWMRDRTQAPTWNFGTVHFLVDIAFSQTEAESANAIELLLDAVEARSAKPWRSQELGERYHRLIKGVIGFRAHVLEARVKFKFGQTERADVYEDIIAGLKLTGNAALAEEMEGFNKRSPQA